MITNDNPVENELIYSDLKNHIDVVIDNLPTQRKKVFLLSTLDGMANKEIAEQLNLSVRTVEVHKSLALKTLKKALNKILK